ncbi:MAG: glycosyltransferase [Bacteroidetes bacterium]|nr:glycosyltransferase [Bacteroidota bacterium]MBU1718927.1 glycosyltransferase [Bacteroidota bacterium]
MDLPGIVCIILIIIALLYAGLILLLIVGWDSTAQEKTRKINSRNRIRASVIIPVRNEEKSISSLLIALNQQDYPCDFTEIIVVDDHSEDNTIAEVLGFQEKNPKCDMKIISLKVTDTMGKKAALKKGINAATGELIIQTDADCIPPPTWISAMVSSYLHSNSVFISGPVLPTSSKNIFRQFQALEYLSLAGSGGAAMQLGLPLMCSAANMAYSRKAFEESGGFSQREDLATGDDVFLMQGFFKKYKNRLIFLKSTDAIVKTAGASSFREFFRQRTRWASKTRFYASFFPIATALVVFLMSAAVLFSIFAAFVDDEYVLLMVYLFGLKFVLDGYFLMKVVSFFEQKKLMIPYPLFAIIYPLYIIISAPVSVFFGAPQWKGRNQVKI